jgi:hypothetical protein
MNVSYRASLSVPPLPSYDRCPELHPQLPFAVVLSFLRYRGRLPPRSFIRLLLYSFPYAIVAFLAFPTSLPERTSFRASWCDLVFVLSLAAVSPAPCHSCRAGHLPAGGSQFRLRSPVSLGPNFVAEVSLEPCYYCTAGHLSAGGSQLPSGPTISSGQFLWLSASPCSYS